MWGRNETITFKTNIMKISDLIRKLEILKAKHGDNELHFSVRDSYDIYGEPANMILNVGEDEKELDWYGVQTRDGETRIKLDLMEQNNKRPKITFRQK